MNYIFHLYANISLVSEFMPGIFHPFTDMVLVVMVSLACLIGSWAERLQRVTAYSLGGSGSHRHSDQLSRRNYDMNFIMFSFVISGV